MTYPIDPTVHPMVTAFFDPETNTISYVVQDPASKAAAIIDPVMDIDYAAGRIGFRSAKPDRRACSRQWVGRRVADRDATRMPTICRRRRICKASSAAKSASASTYHGAGGSARCSTRAPSSAATAVSSTVCSRMARLRDRRRRGIRHAHARTYTPRARRTSLATRRSFGDTLFMPDGGWPAPTFRRRCPHALPLDPQDPRHAAARDAAFHVVRLRAERARHPVGNDGSGGAGTTSMPTTASARTASWRCVRPRQDAGGAEAIVPSLQVNIRAGHLPEPEADGKRFLKVPIDGL